MVNAVFDAYGDLSSLIGDAMIVPAWSPDGKSMGFVSGQADNRIAWRVDLQSGKKTELLDAARLREAVKQATGETPAGQGVPFAHFTFVAANTIAFVVGADQLTLDLGSYEAHVAPKPSMMDAYMGTTEQARRTPRAFKRSMPLIGQSDAYEITSPDGQWLLSIQSKNVSVRSSYDGRAVALTEDGTREIEWNVDWLNPMYAMLGMATPVTNWSPQSDRIAVYKSDNRGVHEMVVPRYLKRFEANDTYYGTIAGGVLERVTLHVLDVASKRTVEIDLGDTRDTYPAFAGWLPDGTGVLVFQMSRDCSRVDISLADPNTGKTRHLFTEQGETFVRIHHDIYYGRKLGLTLTPDAQHILWLSERDGFKHIYKYDLQGKLVGQLTSGKWPVDEVKQVIGDYVYFSAHSDPKRPYDVHFCRVPLSGGKMQQLTSAPGKHSTIVAPNQEVFLDTHSAPDREAAMELRTLSGEVLNDAVSKADISKLKKVGFTPPEEFSVKAADGVTDLWGVMYKPHDFDPKKKYPVIEYIYGGPQIAVADHGFAAASMGATAIQLAQLGAICVVLDARGTPERSKAFHDVVYRDWAGALVADHAAAIKQLAARYPFIDGERVGITGFSWGGYSSTRCLFDAPEVYKCAVSGAPGYDPYSSVLYECYLGLPQKNPAAYQQANVINFANKLQGALMMVAGTTDNLVWRDTMNMAEALIRAGKDFDLVAMPDQGHGYDTPHNAHLHRKAAAFYKQHLRL